MRTVQPLQNRARVTRSGGLLRSKTRNEGRVPLPAPIIFLPHRDAKIISITLKEVIEYIKYKKYAEITSAKIYLQKHLKEINKRCSK